SSGRLVGTLCGSAVRPRPGAGGVAIPDHSSAGANDLSGSDGVGSSRHEAFDGIEIEAPVFTRGAVAAKHDAGDPPLGPHEVESAVARIPVAVGDRVGGPAPESDAFLEVGIRHSFSRIDHSV